MRRTHSNSSRQREVYHSVVCHYSKALSLFPLQQLFRISPSSTEKQYFLRLFLQASMTSLTVCRYFLPGLPPPLSLPAFLQAFGVQVGSHDCAAGLA